MQPGIVLDALRAEAEKHELTFAGFQKVNLDQLLQKGGCHVVWALVGSEGTCVTMRRMSEALSCRE